MQIWTHNQRSDVRRIKEIDPVRVTLPSGADYVLSPDMTLVACNTLRFVEGPEGRTIGSYFYVCSLGPEGLAPPMWSSEDGDTLAFWSPDSRRALLRTWNHISESDTNTYSILDVQRIGCGPCDPSMVVSAQQLAAVQQEPCC